QVATEKFAMAFLKVVTSDPENWITRASHNFVRQCFRLLDLRFNVAIEPSFWTKDHPYRTDNPNYHFIPEPKLMDDVRTFFESLPVLLSHYASALKLDVENCRFDRLTHPVSAYLRVVTIWTKVVHSICGIVQEPDTISSDGYLCEPLARMSFFILDGLSALLPEYANFNGLKDICLSLAMNVRYGIFFQDTSEVIVTPMLDMFKVHYRTFCGVEKSALDFVYCILTIKMDEPDAYIEAYEFLDTMLKQFATSKERDQGNKSYLHMFTNELITVKYVIIVFDTLKRSASKPLLMITLKYLLTLQSHLASFECFTIPFLEILLQLTLRVPHSFSVASCLAAKLYVVLSQRKYEETDIAVHILEVYIKSKGNSRKNPSYEQFRSELDRYLRTIGLFFPALHRFEYYNLILSARNAPIELSLIAAQSASILFERLMADYSTVPEALKQVHLFLRCWPGLVQSASRQTGTRAVLYSIYSMVDFVAVARSQKEVMPIHIFSLHLCGKIFIYIYFQLLLNLESFCLEHFLKDDTLSETEFEGLYQNIYRSADATGNKLIHTTAANYIREKQAQLISLLNATDTEETETVELLETYALSVRSLHSLLIVNKFADHHLADIYPTLAKHLFEKRAQNENLIRYGSESLATMLTSLYVKRDKSNDVMGIRISLLVDQLLDFCHSELSNLNLDFVRAKYLFCSTLILHIANLPDLSLDDAIYGTLLDWLILPPRNSDPELQVEGYVAEMHFVFRRFIQSEHVVLPNNRIWKVLVQYKMGPAFNYLDFELEKLIGVLLEYRIQGYIRCVPGILLHVNGDKKTSKTRFSSILTAHTNIIKRHATAFDSWFVRLIVFQECMKFLAKSMVVRRLAVTSSRQRNRLLPLGSLLHLLTALRLQESHFLMIAKSIHTLKEEVMGPEESFEMESFITEISKFKHQCEDEQTDVEKNENNKGKLIPLPPGPLTDWQ
ncbi:hypothetical protein KR038_007653, partial [Drosophila bunnanda]